MSSPTRRSLLRGASVLPLVMPAGVLASPSPDPALTAIEAWRAAWREVEAAIAAARVIEKKYPEDTRDHARVQVGTIRREDDGTKEPYFAFSHTEIDDWMDRGNFGSA